MSMRSILLAVALACLATPAVAAQEQCASPDAVIAVVTENAETIVDIREGVALDLIKRGIAESLSKPKPKAKKQEKDSE